MQNATGRIQVKAWDKQEVMIVGQRAGTSVEVDTEQVGNRIEIATRATSDNANAEALRADYEITVPTESEIQVRSDSGNVTVDSVHGDMSFDTVAADLALQDVDGYLVIKSIGGSLCARDVRAGSTPPRSAVISNSCSRPWITCACKPPPATSCSTAAS